MKRPAGREVATFQAARNISNLLVATGSVQCRPPAVRARLLLAQGKLESFDDVARNEIHWGTLSAATGATLTELMTRLRNFTVSTVHGPWADPRVGGSAWEADWTARLVPLTVDGLIYASSMVMLDSARRPAPTPVDD